MLCLLMSGQCRVWGKSLHTHLLVSIVDSISACHAEDLGSIPRRGELALFCYRTTHPKFLAQPDVTKGVQNRLRPKPYGMIGRESNPGQLLEGSYARHYTTNAFGGCCLARTVKMLKLEAIESLIGLLELKRSFFEPNPKRACPVFGSHHIQESSVFPGWLNKYEGLTQGQQRLQIQKMTSCASFHCLLVDSQLSLL